MESTHKNLVVFGSPSRDSFTAQLLNEMLERLPGGAVIFDCFATPPAPCDGCGRCKTEAGCRHGDLDGFFTPFAEADQVIFAFPVYNNSFPAPLKALIDRFQLFYNARFSRHEKHPVPGRREVTVLLTRGGPQDVSELVLAQLRPVFTVTGCVLKRCVVLTDTDRLTPGQPLHPVMTDYETGDHL